jgi:hypothetical protein
MEPTKVAPSSPGHCSAALINGRFWTFGIEARLLNILRSVASSARASSPLAIQVRNACAASCASSALLPSWSRPDPSAAWSSMCRSIRSCHKRCGLLSGANKGASTTRDANRWVMPQQTCELVRKFRVGWVLESEPRPLVRVPGGQGAYAIRAFTRCVLWNEFRSVSSTDVSLSCCRSSPFHRSERPSP